MRPLLSITAGRALLLLLSGLALLKLALLAAYGPIRVPDTIGYEGFADEILTGSEWLRDARLEEPGNVLPVTALRIVGYPALIALAKLAGGEAWPWVVAGAQLALSLLATACFFWLCSALGGSYRFALMVAAAQATSLPLLLDQALLPDSMYSSVLVVFVSLLARQTLEPSPAKVGETLGLGLLLAVAFLLRETTQYVSVFFAPLIVYWAWRRSPAWTATLAHCVLLGLPLLISIVAYSAWNLGRTGAWFVTSGGQTAFLVPLAQAARDGAPVFDGDEALDVVARRTFRAFDFAEIAQINVILHRDHAMTGPGIAAATSRKFRAAWRENPTHMLLGVGARLDPGNLLLSVRPLRTLRDLHSWARADFRLPSRRDVSRTLRERWSALDLALLLGYLGFRLVSAALLLGFLLGPPLMAARAALRRAAPEPAALTLLGAWLIFAGFVATFGLIRLEPRYLMPVSALATAGGLVVWRDLCRKWARARRRTSAEASTGS